MIKINNEVIKEMELKKCKSMIGVFNYGLRTNYLLDNTMKLKEIDRIVIFKDGKILFSIGRYFEGQVDNLKVRYDIKKVFLSEVKTRRKENLDRKENFYYNGTLYLYEGLDVKIKEIKEVTRYKNDIETAYIKVALLEFKHNFMYYGKYHNMNREEIENNMLLVDVAGSYRIEKTPQGEKIDSIEKELKESNINIDRYTLEKLLNQYDLIKK